jgi:hypothetical protein
MSDPVAKASVQELKDVLDLTIALLLSGEKALDDGKLSVKDLLLLVDVLPKVAPAVAGVSKVPAELADLSAEEGAELVAHVMASLVLDSEKAKVVVEKSLKVAVAVVELVKAIKA